MFKRFLIVNRGEIAIRVIRACKELGIRTVAVYSEADADALHVRHAEESVLIGPPPPRESYLNVDALLRAALDKGVDAVHPGYGFLSENAGFAQAVRDAGLTFIGPPTEAIRLMGNKAESKIRMKAAGVPTVPGGEGLELARRIPGGCRRDWLPGAGQGRGGRRRQRHARGLERERAAGCHRIRPGGKP